MFQKNQILNQDMGGKMYNINRFVDMHKLNYEVALQEIKNGYKRSHWMWYIFPQLKDLGKSSTSEFYGIENTDEVKEYMGNDYLKNNMLEICNELLKQNENIRYIMGYPDYLKLNSCMTLFEYVFPKEEVFTKVIDKFYKGKRDNITLNILKKKE